MLRNCSDQSTSQYTEMISTPFGINTNLPVLMQISSVVFLYLMGIRKLQYSHNKKQGEYHVYPSPLQYTIC